jgi:hypothetical protein
MLTVHKQDHLHDTASGHSMRPTFDHTPGVGEGQRNATACQSQASPITIGNRLAIRTDDEAVNQSTTGPSASRSVAPAKVVLNQTQQRRPNHRTLTTLHIQRRPRKTTITLGSFNVNGGGTNGAGQLLLT